MPERGSQAYLLIMCVVLALSICLVLLVADWLWPPLKWGVVAWMIAAMCCNVERITPS